MQQESQQHNPALEGEEKEIDLLELVVRLWQQRRFVIKWCIGAIVLGLIVAFSIPKEYTSSVVLAPEATDGKSSGGSLGALASMAGFSSGSSSSDAVYPELYPKVVQSVPFMTDLFNVEVETAKNGEKMALSTFVEDKTKSPWWSAILGLPRKIIGLFGSRAEKEKDHKLNNFRLTADETKLVVALSKMITTGVDNKTGVVTVTVTMQDPLVSALVADTVVSRLQAYITDYRTNKARRDLEYARMLNREAKQSYYKAQQAYAEYLDRNHGLALRSAQTVRDRLENEAALAFNLYNQTAQQVQRAQAKVQETTPVYAVVSPATVPLRASSPKKAMILVAFVFIAFVCSAAWILFIKPEIEDYKKKKKEKEAALLTSGEEKSQNG